MMKKTLLAVLMAALLSITHATAQVENRALLFASDGKVECGIVPEMNGIHSYTVQLWFKPTSWTSGATLLERGDLRIALGSSSGTLAITVNGAEHTVSSSSIASGQWQQLTLFNAKGRVKVRIDNSEVGSFRVNNTGASMDASLTLGGSGYVGLIDEVRIWNKVLTDEFDYFWNNTLNEFNQQLDNLIVYYKMDHEEWTKSLVDYKSLWKPAKTNHHGTITGADFVAVDRRSADKTHVNAKLPYLLSGAYTFTPRLYTAAIPRETYLLSNDIICLFIEMGQDGHLRASLGNDWVPNYTNTATLSGGAQWKSSVSGRKGVVKFDGAEGTYMTCPATTLNSTNFTIEGWIKVDSWVVGATLLRKGDFSVKTGKRSTGELIIQVGEEQYNYDAKLNATGWHYLGISGDGHSFTVVVDDNNIYPTHSGKNAQLTQTDAEVVWGENLKATLDDWAIWSKSIDADGILAHKDGYPMPVLGGKVSQALLNGANTLYHFDNQDYVGLDHYSLEGLKAMMEEAYAGYRGYQFRVAVRASTSEFAWNETITNYEYRQNFARDLAYLVGTYDGAEYDLEWVYYDQWATFGDLIHECRQALPADKSLVCSVHNVTWKFIPTSRIAELDGVTVQQYGPQKNNSTYSNCVSNYNSIKSRYPKEKICLSWASITSNGSTGGAARGLNWGAMGDSYVPSNDMDAWNVDGQDFYFMSPIQVYRRAKLCQDEANMGIFYWEMAHDYRVDNKWCMARYASYGLNANVDRIVTKATPTHPAATGTLAADPDQAIAEVTELQGERVKSESTLTDGAYVAWLCGDNSFDGKAWIGADETYVRSQDSEWTPLAAIFRLDDAGDGCFYLYNMSNQKYLGHADSKSSRGDFYEVQWCDNTSDAHVSRMAIKMVNASGNLYLPSTSAWMFNLDDKAHSTYSSLKVGDTEANFGYLGTNSWKVWLMYTFDRRMVNDHFGIATITPGDVNDDGLVNRDDVGTLVTYLIGGKCDKFVTEAADLDGDGKIDVIDLALLIDLVLSL